MRSLVRRHTSLLTAAVIAAVSAFAPLTTFAADTQSITLSPSSTNVTLQPGITATRDLTILNDGDVPYTASISVSPYRVEGIEYNPQFTRAPGTTDPSSWATLSQTKISLAPHTNVIVPYSLTAPKATAPGGYYAVIFVESANGDASSGVSTRNRIGNILYITVAGQVNEAGGLSEAGLSSFIFGTSVPLSMRVSNSGGVHFQSQSKVTVKSITGKEVFSFDGTHYVLPQTTRLISTTWNPRDVIGIYTVSRSATVAGENKSLPDKLIVVATPGIIPLLVFAVLAIAGFILLFSKRRKSRKKAPKPTESS